MRLDPFSRFDVCVGGRSMHRFDDVASAVAAVDSYAEAGRRAMVRAHCGDSPHTSLIYENGPKLWHRMDHRPRLYQIGALIEQEAST